MKVENEIKYIAALPRCKHRPARELRGSAYCPNKNGEVEAIGKLLNDLKESHSIKKWGR